MITQIKTKNRTIKVHHKKNTVSTNIDAKQAVCDGELFVADCQSGGRGRMDRTFVSPVGGVYMSLYLDVKEKTKNILFITSAAAVAASYALDNLTGSDSMIKWVNDIYYKDKKVCGILAEGVIENNTFKSVVLGVGLNLLKKTDFSAELAKRAGYVFESGDFKKLRDKFITDFVNKFFELYDSADTEEIHKTYCQKNYLLGKKVSFNENGKEISGTVTGIRDDIALTVGCGGEEKNLTFGEVNISF